MGYTKAASLSAPPPLPLNLSINIAEMSDGIDDTSASKRMFDTAFPHLSDANNLDDEESGVYYPKRPRSGEDVEVTNGERDVPDVASGCPTLGVDEWHGYQDVELYGQQLCEATEYAQGVNAYRTHALHLANGSNFSSEISSHFPPAEPEDEWWSLKLSQDPDTARFCEEFQRNSFTQADLGFSGASGSHFPGSLNYNIEHAAQQYYPGIHITNEHLDPYYPTATPRPSTNDNYDHHTCDDPFFDAVSTAATTSYPQADHTSSSLFYYDHYPPSIQAGMANVSLHTTNTTDTAADNYEYTNTMPQTPVTQEISMTSIPEVLPNSVESFIFNASTQDQFEGNVDIESARQRVGLDSDSVLPGMKVPLMPHQITGVAWMLDKEEGQQKGGCLGDEMGLGKTIQMITVLVKNRPSEQSQKTTLIIAPMSLLDQWKQELETKTDCGLKCLVYHGPGRTRVSDQLSQYDAVLTTYSTMSNECPDYERHKEAGPLFKLEFYRIVLDEAQSIRNRWTVASRAVSQLKAVYRWCLTGTPIVNALVDAYGYLRFLKILPWCDFSEFQRHIGKEEKKSPTLASRRLQAILKTFLLRRKKDSTLDGKRLIELPEKTVDLVKLEFSQDERDIYNMVEARTQAKFNRFLQAGTVLKNYHQVLVLLLRLRQVCSHPSLIQEEGIISLDTNGKGVDPITEQNRAASLVSSQFVEKVKRKFQEIHENRMKAEEESPDAIVEDDDCPICFDTLTNSVITACLHIFCKDCINEAIDHSRAVEHGPKERPCPVCRSAISKEKLFSCIAFEPQDEISIKKETSEEFTTLGGDHSEISGNGDIESKLDAWNNKSHCPPPSAKMKFMMEQLRSLMIERPDEKVLIVSQWTSCLSLVSKYLQEEGIIHVSYQGDMDRKQRSQSVVDFTSNPQIRVMLMSLKCGGVGLNLTRANHVISLDLGWSQAVEAQAFDRVHRLGQNRTVTVQRLAIANTIEDRVLQMQERKQALTDGSLGEGTGKKIKLSVRELANLFGLDQYGHVLNVF